MNGMFQTEKIRKGSWIKSFFMIGIVIGLGVQSNIAFAQWIGCNSGGGGQQCLTDGNVGIGTLNPAYKLDVNGGLRIQNGGIQVVSSSGFEIYGFGGLGFNLFSEGDLFFLGGTGRRLHFGSNNVNSQVVLNNGNLGIGTATPSSKLHVVGDVTVTGNIAAKYQDVAEWVTSPKAVPAGTVVILDAAHSNQVLPSVRAYDTRVAGVVSERPGLLLGEAGEGKVKVATTGRVKVKVDASTKPVQVGDLLVTSDKEGIAMKSEPIDLGGVPIHRPGTLIGKALEPLKEREGEILVLLSLQ